MALSTDPVVIINLIFCIVILALGYFISRKRDNFSALLIGIAFGMFGLSHFTELFGITMIPDMIIMLVRICGYLMIVAALWLYYTE